MATNISDDVASRVRQAIRAAPISDTPGIAYAAAQTAEPDAAAQAAASFRWGYQTRQQLEGLDDNHQRTAWSGYSEDERKLLQGMGYHPPEKHRGFWGGIGHFFAHIPSSIHAGAVFGPLGASLRAVQRGHRAAVLVDELPTGIGDFLSPSAWARAWNATQDGEKNLSAGAPERIFKFTGLPNEFHDIAVDSATGMDLNSLVGKYGSDKVGAAQTAPEWERTLDLLNRSHISVGRRVANFEGGLPPTGKLATLASGAFDGAFDVLGDPVNIPLAKASRALKARYLVRSAEDVEHVFQFRGAQVAAKRILGHFDEGGGGVAGVLGEFPQLHPVSNELAEWAKNEPKTLESLKGFYTQLAGLKGAETGVGTGFFRAVPHTGPVGIFKTTTKLAAHDAIDWWADHHPRIPGTMHGPGFLRGMANLYTKTKAFALEGPNASKVFEQVSRLYPFSRSVRERYLNNFLAGNLAERHNRYVSLINDVFHALGSDFREGITEPATQIGHYHRSILGLVEDEATRPFGHDMTGRVSTLVETPTGTRSFGISEHQFTTFRTVPNVMRLAEAARADSLLGGYLPSGWIRSYIGTWKALTLARIGFPLRVGGEEAARFILDEGLVPYLRASRAKEAVGELRPTRTARLASSLEKKHPSAAAALGRAVPASEGLQSLTHYVADKVKWLASRLPGQLSDEWYDRAAAVAVDEFGAGMLPDGIVTGGFHQAYRAGEGPEGLIRTLRNHRTGKIKEVRMVPQEWGSNAVRDMDSLEMWQSELKSFHKDPSFQAALEHAGNPAAARAAVHNLMLSPEWAPNVEKAAMIPALMEGGMSKEEAIAELARRTSENAFALTHSPDGTPLPFLEGLRGGEIPAIEDLHDLPLESLPKSVAGQKLVPVDMNSFQRLTDRFFGWSDRVINDISREPLYVAELAKGLARIEPEVAKLIPSIGEEAARKLGNDWAMRAAYDAVKPNIHNPEVRNLFEQYHQAIMPFWFAKEQWLRRWGRTLLTNPAAARRAQLLMMGLRHSGFMHQDENGEDYFFYPQLPFGKQIIGNVASLITGKDAKFPVDVAFTGSVKFLSPGLSEGPAPGVGPFVGLGLGLLRRRWPLLFTSTEQQVLGERGAGRPLWMGFVPSVVSNLYRSTIGKAEDDAQVASAMNQAILQLHALGLDPKQDATADERQEFLHRVSVWTRANLIMRTMLGFAAPSVPQLDIAADELRPELLGLMKTLPFEEAMAEFMRRHPDAGYLTIFSTTSKSGSVRPLPVTHIAGEWLKNNQGFVRRYGSAATYFIPDAPEGFDQAAWREELAIGLRVRKTPEMYWRDLQISADKEFYYSHQRAYYALRAQMNSPAERSALDQQWRQKKSEYLASRPMLEEWIHQGGDRQDARKRVLGDLIKAVNDPERPKTADDAALVRFIDGYKMYSDSFNALTGRRDSEASALRRRYTSVFSDWAQGFTVSVVRSVYDQLIAPDLPRYEVQNG